MSPAARALHGLRVCGDIVESVEVGGGVRQAKAAAAWHRTLLVLPRGSSVGRALPCELRRGAACHGEQVRVRHRIPGLPEAVLARAAAVATVPVVMTLAMDTVGDFAPTPVRWLPGAAGAVAHAWAGCPTPPTAARRTSCARPLGVRHAP